MNTSKTNWHEVDALKDEDIDYSDIPELDENFFKTATVVMPKKKKIVTLRLDEEIIDFFKAREPKYQTKINAVLMAYVKSHA